MAQEFEVPFLGSIPIDPMFIRLIEEGKRPRYPEGTIIEGQDMQTTNTNDDDTTGLLVEKYTACSLCPLFSSITKGLTAEIER